MSTYVQHVESLRKNLLNEHNSYIADSYSALRHALFLTNTRGKKLSGVTDIDLLPPAQSLTQSDALTHSSLQEFAWAQHANSILDPAAKSHSMTTWERVTMLRGLCRSRAAVDVEFLLDQIGESEYMNVLVREALQYSLNENNREQVTHDLHDRIFTHDRRSAYFVLTRLLDIAAEYHLSVLTDFEILYFLKHWSDREQVLLALLRYISVFEQKAVVFDLHNLLLQNERLSLMGRIAVIDTLVQLDDPTSPDGLRYLDARIHQIVRADQAERLQWHLRTAIRALETEEQTVASNGGVIVAQCMFQGQVGRPGSGDSGGLSVFLRSLGDVLAQTPQIDRVYTLVLQAAGTSEIEYGQLCVQNAPNHFTVNVPVYVERDINQHDMLVNEYALRKAIEWTLKRYHIEPDIFHVRYSDMGSKVVVDVAKQMGKKVVFTITPDPHRNLENRFARQTLDPTRHAELHDKLHTVYISDYILEQVDGLVAMPTNSETAYLKAYFPQLELRPQIQSKPLRVIAEGITLDMPQQDSKRAQQEILQCLYQNNEGQGKKYYRLEKSFSHNPIILNIGRLNPVKQQHLLVEAWAKSDLWKSYNLILISGNLDQPNPTERDMLKRIEDVVVRYPQVVGRLCLLGAMSNADVRLLERSIIQQLQTDLPHVYVCSSVKEEFGIAVLEAMSAGFLTIGPERGGLSSYVSSGENGFLMDTSSAASMAEALATILLDRRISAKTLHVIAEEGIRTIHARFDIRQIAPEFARFYEEIVTSETQSGGN